MNPWLDTVLVLLMLTNLHLLGSSRLERLHPHGRRPGGAAGRHSAAGAMGRRRASRLALLTAVSTAIKAGVLPWLLRRAVREAGVRSEVEPLVGFTTSLLLGPGAAGRGPARGRPACRCPAPTAPTFLVPVALFTMMVGLLLIVGRRKAVMQALGYLAMENGIYAFGLAFAVEEPLLVEMGVLLDVFVAVFVMGITIHHISREFDHIDTDRLSALKD